MSDAALDSTLTHRERAAVAWRAVWPLLVAALLFAALAGWRDGRFPEAAYRATPEATPEQLAALKAGLVPSAFGWVDWGIFAAIPLFLALKNLTMARRMTYVDWLAVSLIAANASFMLLYSLVVFGDAYPYWFATHREAVTLFQSCLRACLIVSLAWTSALLILVPEPDRVRFGWLHERLAPVLVVGSAVACWWAWASE